MTIDKVQKRSKAQNVGKLHNVGKIQNVNDNQLMSHISRSKTWRKVSSVDLMHPGKKQMKR